MSSISVLEAGTRKWKLSADDVVSVGDAARLVAEAYREAQGDDTSPHIRTDGDRIIVEKCSWVPEVSVSRGSQAGTFDAEIIGSDQSLFERMTATLREPGKTSAGRFGHP